MPTYDYECQACSHRFEAFQSITSGALRKCPDCGKLRLRRLIGCGAGIIFKGSGFYETDYRSKSYRDQASKEKSDAATTSSKSTSKGADSKSSGAEKKKAASSSEGS